VAKNDTKSILGDMVDNGIGRDNKDTSDKNKDRESDENKATTDDQDIGYSREYYEAVAVDEAGDEARYIEEIDAIGKGYDIENYLEEKSNPGNETTEMGSFGAREGKSSHNSESDEHNPT